MTMQYDSQLAFAKDLALEARKIMQRYFRSQDLGTSWKSDNTPLTFADTAVNDLVISKVKEQFPTHGVIGEESNYATDSEWVWVCDPIDGTMPFTLSIPVSTFSLALVSKSDGQAKVAVVYDMGSDDIFSAVDGGGAFVNDKTLLCTSKAVELKNAYLSIIGGTSADPRSNKFRPGYCSDLARDQNAKPFCLYSQVYSAIKVATGDFAGSIFGYGMPWDSAAVSLIVHEAGGIVTDLEGKQRRYDEVANGCVLAANQSILHQLLDLVQKSQ